MQYKPISQKDIARCEKHGSKMLPGVFLGYEIHAGGKWSKDLLVADWEDFQEAELVSEVHVKRFKAAEVQVMLRSNSNQKSFRFPIAEGNLKQPGGQPIEVVRRTRRAPTQDEEEEIRVKTEKEEKKAAEEEADAKEYEPDFWTVTADLLIRHHNVPRSKLFMPDEVSDCPVPTKYLDVMRTTNTNLDTWAEKAVEDLWTEDGPRELSFKWIG